MSEKLNRFWRDYFMTNLRIMILIWACPLKYPVGKNFVLKKINLFRPDASGAGLSAASFAQSRVVELVETYFAQKLSASIPHAFLVETFFLNEDYYCPNKIKEKDFP